MKRKKCIYKKNHPVKYLRYKGCFGHGPFEGIGSPIELVKMKDALALSKEVYAEPALTRLQRVMDNPDAVLDMREVKQITLRFGLILKAFYDEFMVTHTRVPSIYPPKAAKVKAILNHLGVASYPGIHVEDYPDIVCWQIVDWELLDYGLPNRTKNSLNRDIKPAELLYNEIIPKCWSGKRTMANDSRAIASSISEVLFNCEEHAYTGVKEDSKFRKWYLGVGEYPDTKRFSFCIYDKGVGIRDRMQQNPQKWFDRITDLKASESSMIKLATQGRSGANNSNSYEGSGRGQGLKSAIEQLDVNAGQMSIFSGKGVFESEKPNLEKDRKSKLEGTMIAFSFPINYSENTK